MIGLMTTRNQQHNRDKRREEKPNKARDLKSENFDGRFMTFRTEGYLVSSLGAILTPQGRVTSLPDGWSAILATYEARSRPTLRDPL